jgi:hypothetical protein
MNRETTDIAKPHAGAIVDRLPEQVLEWVPDLWVENENEKIKDQ